MEQGQGSFYKQSMTNPMAKKLEGVQERAESRSATYSGIVLKTVFFLLLTVGGMVLYFMVREIYLPNADMTVSGSVVSRQELWGMTAAALVTVFSPILIWLVRPLAPVFGSLYCAGQGFALAGLCTVMGGEYRRLAWLALGLTLLIVFVMLVLYVTGVVKVTAKLRSVLTTLMVSGFLLSMIVFLCSLIPFLRPVSLLFTQNLGVSVVTSVIFIIIASLFLLVDFDCIEHTVKGRLPKNYEWFAAMSLVFTVIWLYLKVLNLLLRLTSSGKRNQF